MDIKRYPSDEDVDKAIEDDEPFLAVISFDGSSAIVAPAVQCGEHHILLMQNGHKSTDIDCFFRIAFDREGADWTFVCPPDYKGLDSDEARRIGAFYKDGFYAISCFLQEMDYIVGIKIP
ncbi:MAG: hypothetical protein IKR73_00415, partial [Oscillospiraceae bacterium]|nr:hypothetical protein [Oscillospiraceae bacterium]